MDERSLLGLVQWINTNFRNMENNDKNLRDILIARYVAFFGFIGTIVDG